MALNRTTPFAASLFGLLVGCASQAPLPSNASISPGANGGSYLDRVDFSYQTPSARDFSQLKMCVAENISNNDVSLSDATGSFVGAYTGNYYQNSNVQTVAGKAVFKYVDEQLATLIANGTTISISQQLVPIKDIVKYEVKAGVSGSSVTLVFYNITRAQQNTGYAANDGFNPVGVWSGARSQDVYASLDAVANKVKACME